MVDIDPKANSTPPQKGMRAFIDRGRGATGGNSTVLSNSHLQIGHQWSEQHQLDCVGTVNLQFQGPFFRISFQSIV